MTVRNEGIDIRIRDRAWWSSIMAVMTDEPQRSFELGSLAEFAALTWRRERRRPKKWRRGKRYSQEFAYRLALECIGIVAQDARTEGWAVWPSVRKGEQRGSPSHIRPWADLIASSAVTEPDPFNTDAFTLAPLEQMEDGMKTFATRFEDRLYNRMDYWADESEQLDIRQMKKNAEHPELFDGVPSVVQYREDMTPLYETTPGSVVDWEAVDDESIEDVLAEEMNIEPPDAGTPLSPRVRFALHRMRLDDGDYKSDKEALVALHQKVKERLLRRGVSSEVAKAVRWAERNVPLNRTEQGHVKHFKDRAINELTKLLREGDHVLNRDQSEG